MRVEHQDGPERLHCHLEGLCVPSAFLPAPCPRPHPIPKRLYPAWIVEPSSVCLHLRCSSQAGPKPVEKTGPRRSVKWVRGQAGIRWTQSCFPLDLEGTVARSDCAEAARGLQVLPGSWAGPRPEEPGGEGGSFTGARTMQMSQPAGGTGAAEILPSDHQGV